MAAGIISILILYRDPNSDTGILLFIYAIAFFTALVLVIILIWQITLNQEKKRREQAGGASLQPKPEDEAQDLIQESHP